MPMMTLREFVQLFSDAGMDMDSQFEFRVTPDYRLRDSASPSSIIVLKGEKRVYIECHAHELAELANGSW